MAGPRSAPRRPAAGATPGAGGPGGLAARRRGRLRALPSVDEVVRALDGRPAASRDPRGRTPCGRSSRSGAGRCWRRRRRPSWTRSPSRPRRSCRGCAPRSTRPGPGGSTAWSTRPGWCCTRTSGGRRSAGRRWRGSRSSRPGTRISSWTSARRRAARATSTSDGLLCRLSGRRGLARGQQQRRGRPARAGVARAGPRGRGVAGRADRDRRRLPDPGHHGPVGRAPGRGRDDEPDAPRRLRERDHAGDRAPPQGASLELPGGGLHGERPHRGARRAGPGARRSGARGSRLRLLPRPPAVGPAARADGAGDGRRRRRRGHLLGRQAPRGPAGRDRRGPAGARRASAPEPAQPGAPDRQAHPGGARGDAPGVRGSGDGAARDPDPPHAERVGGRRPSPRAPRPPPGAGGRPHGARPGGRGRPVRGGRRRAPTGRAPDRRARARHRGDARRRRWTRGSGRVACRSSAASPPTVCCWTAGPSWTTRCRSSPPP